MRMNKSLHCCSHINFESVVIKKMCKFLPHFRFNSVTKLPLLTFHRKSHSIYNEVESIPSRLFSQHHFVKTLEVDMDTTTTFPRFNENENSLLQKVLHRNVFHATVHPDLPEINSLTELYHPMKNKNKKKIKETELERPLNLPTTASSVCLWQVRTIACQTHSYEFLCNRIIEQSSFISSSGNGGSLLLVSGGHPVRQIPFFNHFLPMNSIQLLQISKKLKKQGRIASDVELWCVENPLTNNISQIEKKIENGAEAVITQPPLLPDRFRAWWQKVEERSLQKKAKIIIGIPIISSFKNFLFWMNLTNARGSEANSVLENFKKKENSFGNDDPIAFQNFRIECTMALLSMVQNLPGVAGIHVMPVTKRGWRDLDEMLTRNLL